jgi:drug/metabolite transporter (DMT)-like permease
MVLVFVGAYIFFNAPLPAQSLSGVLITLLSGVGWAVYLVAGRLFFAKEEIDPLGLTAFSMGFGSLFIAMPALAFKAITKVSMMSWAIILWLAVVNTAIAFFLWNHALKRIEAFEISVLQNTMLIQIGLLAWIFLGEKLTLLKLTAMALVFSGTLVVQLRR